MNKSTIAYILGGLTLGGIGLAVALGGQEDEGEGPQGPQLEQTNVDWLRGGLDPTLYIAPGALEAKELTLENIDFAQYHIPAAQIIGQIQKKNVGLFTTPTRAKDLVFDRDTYAGKTDGQLRRYTIIVNSISEWHYFGGLLAVCWFLIEQGGDQAKIADRILNWFFYHRWVFSDPLQDIVAQQLVRFSCSIDEAMPSHQYGAYPAVRLPLPQNAAATRDAGGDTSVYPAFHKGTSYEAQDGSGYVPGACHNQDALSPVARLREAKEALGDRFFGKVSVPRGELIAQPGPPGALIEYAIARYMQFSFLALLDPAAGEEVGKQLIGSAGAAISTAAAAIGVFSAVSSAVPVVGWVIGAIGVVVKFFESLFGVMATIGRTREARETVAASIWKHLQATWTQYGYPHEDSWEKVLSGYRMDVLLPRELWGGIDVFNDTTDPLWHEFSLSSSRSVRVLPQLPFFYLFIDFPFPVSVDAGLNNVITINPAMQGRNVVGWSQAGYSFKDYVGVLKKFWAANPLQ